MVYRSKFDASSLRAIRGLKFQNDVQSIKSLMLFSLSPESLSIIRVQNILYINKEWGGWMWNTSYHIHLNWQKMHHSINYHRCWTNKPFILLIIGRQAFGNYFNWLYQSMRFMVDFQYPKKLPIWLMIKEGYLRFYSQNFSENR